jgi:hypothetical protein
MNNQTDNVLCNQPGYDNEYYSTRIGPGLFSRSPAWATAV